MLITESQARNNLCPLIRYCVNQVGVIQDRESAIYEHQPCQGSDCKVGWRWAETTRAAQSRATSFDDPLDDVRRGYCGAFGRPENV